MTGFKPHASGINGSTNWATTSTPATKMFYRIARGPCVLDSVTRLGYFWKVLETCSLPKLTQILGNFLCNFTKHSLYIKTVLAPLWATLDKIGLLLILATGHTDSWINKIFHFFSSLVLGEVCASARNWSFKKVMTELEQIKQHPNTFVIPGNKHFSPSKALTHEVLDYYFISKNWAMLMFDGQWPVSCISPSCIASFYQ